LEKFPELPQAIFQEFIGIQIQEMSGLAEVLELLGNCMAGERVVGTVYAVGAGAVMLW
jgi:hypothetical protein